MLSPLLLLALLPAPQAQSGSDWPHWRGPLHTGVSPTPAPVSWGDGEVRWQVELPGHGVSSPIVLGDLLFLTTAVPTSPPEESSEEEPEAPGERGERGGRGRGRRDSGPQVEQRFELHCIDRAAGDTRWRAVARTATPHEGHHRSYGSFASASPVSDGERIYVSFGTQGLYAYSLEGKELWSFDPGVTLRMRNSFGEGLAPALAGDVLVQVFDHEGDSFALGLDKRTGKELWRVARDEPSTWATPLVTEVAGRLQVVTSGTERVRAYDPANGDVLWECGGLGLNAIPAVVRADDLVLAMSGYRGAAILAVELGGEGDLTESGAVAWSAQKGCAYTASPVLHDGLYYTVTDRGQVSCFDAASGEPLYLEERLPRGSTLKSSPVAAGDFLYFPTEAGEVHLVRLGPEYVVEHTNVLKEQVFVASPAVAGGNLFLRSTTHLLCIGDD